MLHVKGSDPTQNPSTIPSTDFARSPTPAARTTYTDWKSIFAAAADVDYYHWEYDLSPDPFASSKVAFNLLELRARSARSATSPAASAAPCRRRSSLTLGAPRLVRRVHAGRRAASTRPRPTATVISTAGDATLSYADPGHLTNGAFSLAAAAAGRALEVGLDRAGVQRAGDGRVQAVDRRTDALRTGSYSKTLTFTLSTTQP